jgi:nickel/cobalt transporter (NicO) family protein
MLLLAMIFLAGVVHGLGPDHLAAITAFGAVVGRDFRRITFFAGRFAAGHVVVISGAALLMHAGRTALPLRWERGFDLTAAGFLIIIGIVLLLGLLSRTLSLHAHQHRHHGLGSHQHFHAHFGSQEEHKHAHGKLAIAAGALFAFGGMRSLLLIVPVAISSTMLVAIMRIGAFALGIAFSMSAYGLLAGRVLTRAIANWNARSACRPHWA